MEDQNNEAMVLAVDNTMARLSITYSGQQGDMPDLVPYDVTDDDLRRIATEAVRDGYVPGIDAFADVDFTDFVVDRFPARDDVPFNRLSLRPKTPFGAFDQVSEEVVKKLENMSYNDMLLRWRHAPMGDPMFLGKNGEYFAKVMREKKAKLSAAEQVAASKNVGW